MTNKTNRTTLYLDDEEHEFLRTFAFNKRMSMNKVIRQLLSHLMDNQEMLDANNI
jgi:hypothetical protein